MTAIQSVLDQNVTTEIILVDDSDEPIANALPNLGNLKVIREYTKPPNSQFFNRIGYARNIGFKECTGDYVAFLDSDDIWADQFLQEMIKTINSNESNVAAISFSEKIYEPGFSFFTKMKLIILNFIKDLFLIFNYFSNNKFLMPTAPFLVQISHILFKRELFYNYSFDTSMQYCEDWKLIFEVQMRNTIQICPKRLLSFRYSPSSNTFNQKKQIGDNKKQTYIALINYFEKQYKLSVFLKLFKIYTYFFLIEGA